MIEYSQKELELFESIMKREYVVRDSGFCTDSQQEELPILKSLVSKISRTIAVAREHGLVKTPKRKEVLKVI